MRKKYNALLIIIILVILLVTFFGVYVTLLNKTNTKKVTKVIDEIKDYSYSLKERDTKLMKDKFSELNDILKVETINYEEYAKLIAQLFIIDLFTIDNKNNMYDIGGVEYVLESEQENYRLNIENTLYAGIENYLDRRQQLPIVKSITDCDITMTKYEYNNKTYDAYEVKLAWDYETDLGYDESATVTIVKIAKKLYIAKYVA